MAVNLTCRLAHFLSKLEIEDRARYDDKELMRRFCTTKRGLTALLNDEAVKIDLRVCQSILTFFHEHGLYLNMAHLFSLDLSGVGCPPNIPSTEELERKVIEVPYRVRKES